jgi:hypothetical protein
MDENSEKKVFFKEKTAKPDFVEAFYSACALLNADCFIEVKKKPLAGLKAKVSFNARKNSLEAVVSDGFECASREVVLGLALSLVSRALRKKIPERAAPLVDSFKEFYSRESVNALSDSLRATRGRNAIEDEGAFFDLNLIMEKVFEKYASVFEGVSRPQVSWSRDSSRRRLGFHDNAFKKIVVSRSLDSRRVPEFVIEYIVFHEFLHCKHKVLYQRGRSLRRTVHSRDFKNDERKFEEFERANEWLARNARKLA